MPAPRPRRKPARTAKPARPRRKLARTAGKPARRTARRAAPRRGARPDPQRVAAIVRALRKHDPDPRCALDYATPYELIVAVILSAQCTDKRVNLTTPALFSRYPDAASLARAEQADVEELIRSTGFFRNKAKNLIGMARGLVQAHGGKVPPGMDELLALPGVARKTANVVRGEVFHLADGVVVDTHVTRLTHRLALTRHTDPVKIERDLMEILPREEWIAFSHRLIRLGRTICTARKPQCPSCPLDTLCPKVGVSPRA